MGTLVFMDTTTNPKPANQNRIKMVCLECGKTKLVSVNAKTEPRCSCGSVDLDVA
jgi:endogenous inhibitor of DNA gyrase (YacG/DUF329 family)